MLDCRGDVNLCRKVNMNGEAFLYTTLLFTNLRIQSLDMMTLWEYTGDVERPSQNSPLAA
jgi:hypothetical protein